MNEGMQLQRLEVASCSLHTVKTQIIKNNLNMVNEKIMLSVQNAMQSVLSIQNAMQQVKVMTKCYAAAHVYIFK